MGRCHVKGGSVVRRKTSGARLPSPTRRRAIRVRAGATLEEVGELVGVSGEAVRLWETGQRTPSESHRGDYVDVLDALRTG
jgi:DNA-binding transcriptional regulator YiaG